MQSFSRTYCNRCDAITAHDIYISEKEYLHSLCTSCGKDVASDSEVSHQSGTAEKHCSRCERITEHIRYTSKRNYPHWFCCSCGKDVAGASAEL
jgi:hypothetical protein